MSQMLYTVVEAAKVLSIGRTRLYELINAGHLEAVKIGTSTRIRDEALRAFVESLPQMVGE